MEKTKILFVNQEIYPFVRESSMSKIGRYLPQGIQERGKEIRTFMPRYGIINERRNQLHEVIRLSGMNLIVNDVDHPLILKVASIQAARMQIYFIDNEEYFYKKNMFHDKNDELYCDIDEKIIFFARGVLETVRKLNWVPDIIHCSGWFSSLVPLYVKHLYHINPLFSRTKIITNIFKDSFAGCLNEDLVDKLLFDNVPEKQFSKYKDFSHSSLIKMAIDNSDGIVFVGKDVDKDFISHTKSAKKKFTTINHESLTFVEEFDNFYQKFL